MKFTFLLLLAIYTTTTLANRRDLAGGGYYARVLGQSGKITLGKTPQPNDDPDAITIVMDRLAELNADLEEIGHHGQDKHVINSFATQSFSFGDLESVQLGTANATTFRFASTLDNGAVFAVDVYLIEEGGVFSLNENETITLTEGALKFNVQIEGWDFCGRNGYVCTNEESQVGEFLELDISVRGKNNNVTSDSRLVSLGDDMFMDLVPTVRVDGVWSEVPSITNDGSLFSFRFPAFDTELFYDPVIQGSVSGTESGVSGDLIITLVLVFSAVSLFGLAIFIQRQRGYNKV